MDMQTHLFYTNFYEAIWWTWCYIASFFVLTSWLILYLSLFWIYSKSRCNISGRITWKNFRALDNMYWGEAFALLAFFIIGVCIFCHLQFHGAFTRCLLVEDCRPGFPWRIILFYVVSFSSLPLIAYRIKKPFTKADWKHWAVMVLIYTCYVVFIGKWAFWNVYGPAPNHEWPPAF